MPKKIGSVDRSVLINAALPSATKTYTVISHEYAIKTIEEALAKNNFEVVSTDFRCTADAKVAHGTFIMSYVGDPDLRMMYTFSNSYDKSLRFRAAIGAQVKTNEAFMISNMDSWLRKHTGTADNETETLINEHIENAEEYFQQLQKDKESMKLVNGVTKNDFGQILGELFINGYLAVDQMSLIQREYDKASFAYAEKKDNLWTCYNFIIHALRQSHPSKWMTSQLAVHLFFVTKYNLVEFDDDQTTTENDSHETGTSQIQYLAKSDCEDAVVIGDNITVEDIECIITGEDHIEEIHYWVCEPVKEPVITGIHEGVEKLPPLLPGFGEPAPVAAEVVEEVVDPNQLDLEQVAKESVEEVTTQTPEGATAQEIGTAVHEVIEEKIEAHVETEEAYAARVAASDGGSGAEEPVGEAGDANNTVNNIDEPQTELDAIVAETMDQPSVEGLPQTESPIAKQAAEAIETFDPKPEEKEDEAPFHDSPEAAASAGTTEEDPDNMYFSQEEYTGVQIGDVLEVNDLYYEIKGVDNTEDQDYWVCKEVSLEEDPAEEEVPITDTPSTLAEKTPAIIGAESAEEVAQVREALAEQGLAAPVETAETQPDLPPFLPENDAAEIPVAEPVEQEVKEDPLEVEAEIPEQAPTDLAKDESPVQKAIAQELEDIYGYAPEFTFTPSGNQYNIVLESGETITLSAAYIDSMNK